MTVGIRQGHIRQGIVARVDHDHVPSHLSTAVYRFRRPPDQHTNRRKYNVHGGAVGVRRRFPERIRSCCCHRVGQILLRVARISERLAFIHRQIKGCAVVITIAVRQRHICQGGGAYIRHDNGPRHQIALMRHVRRNRDFHINQRDNDFTLNRHANRTIFHGRRLRLAIVPNLGMNVEVTISALHEGHGSFPSLRAVAIQTNPCKVCGNAIITGIAIYQLDAAQLDKCIVRHR